MSDTDKIEAIKRLHWGFPANQQDPNNCEDPECSLCSILLCPHHEMMHLHHDGCPAEYCLHDRNADCGQYCRHHQDDPINGCQHKPDHECIYNIPATGLCAICSQYTRSHDNMSEKCWCGSAHAWGYDG